MKKLTACLSAIAILAMVLSLTACGPMYRTTHTYVAPKTRQGRMCANQCLSVKSECENRCNMIYQRCHAAAYRAAQPSFRSYAREQHLNSQPVLKTVNNFADYSACRPTCNCDPTYIQCFTNCGGTIRVGKVCTAFCNKK